MHRTAKSAVAAATLAASVAAALTGAGTGRSARAKEPPSSPLKPLLAQVQGLGPQARDQKLADLAKQAGGSVVWYTSLDLPISTKIVSGFESSYPGLKLSLYRANSETVDARVYAEESAATSGADVIETNGPDMVFFQHKKDILVPYRGSPFASEIPAKYRFDTWTADRVNNFVIAWNTNLVPPGQEPKSLFELAQPKWKNKISMEASDADWYAVAYQYYEQRQLAKLKHYTSAKLQAAQRSKVDHNLDVIFKKLAQNSQLIVGHITQANLLAAGSIAVTVSQYAHTLEGLEAKKAPVSFLPLAGPIFRRPQGVGIAYRGHNPAGAMLFYDWLLSKNDGQKTLLENGANPANPSLVDPKLAGATVVPIDLHDIVAHWGAWSKRYNSVIH
jgi:iron(III) transport system substrate-binding protein